MNENKASVWIMKELYLLFIHMELFLKKKKNNYFH